LKLSGPPESYNIKLAENASVKIRQVKGELFEKKLIRAIIHVKEKEHVIIKRKVPPFLKIFS
ncbi:MAG: hypothetical protein ACTSRA_10120, partial [Promethearchaeota archaeon]